MTNAIGQLNQLRDGYNANLDKLNTREKALTTELESVRSAILQYRGALQALEQVAQLQAASLAQSTPTPAPEAQPEQEAPAKPALKAVPSPEATESKE